MTNSKKILIAVPVAVSCKNRTVESIYNLKIPFGVTTGFRIVEGYTVDTARNRIVNEAIAGAWDYVLFVDSDIILPPHTLERLTAVDADVVTGWYIKKIEGDGITELYGSISADKSPTKEEIDMANILEKDLPKTGDFYQITGCGFGCTLVKTSTLANIKEKYGECFTYVHDGKQICSEDLDFCRKVRKEEGKIMADVKLRCGHIGDKIF